MTKIYPKSLLHKYQRKTSPPGESSQTPNQDQKAQVSQTYFTVYRTTYQFQQPLKSDENTALNADDVSSTLAYQRILPLEFLNKEPDLNATLTFRDLQLKINAERAFKGFPDFEMALYDPPSTFEALASKLRSSLKVATDRGQSLYFQQQQFYTDRNFYGRDRYSQQTNRDRYQKHPKNSQSWDKKCWVCYKPRCWSTNHTKKEQQHAREQYNRNQNYEGRKSGSREYRLFLMSYEGELDDSDNDSQLSSIEDKDDISSNGGTSTLHFTSPCAPANDKNCFCNRKTSKKCFLISYST
ncbi:hypothetical protein GcM1_197003 [Golovinomyces cichoracearum]|uniref:Uncharacterized protein n=1 Tax=Golovinomyces cichoracearum TaxID=62708 RepID=A0A420IZJ5_9PEZI|nr:hypothetical protein GcM1_197003 [Golovinomyces cichoracearum]